MGAALASIFLDWSRTASCGVSIAAFSAGVSPTTTASVFSTAGALSLSACASADPLRLRGSLLARPTLGFGASTGCSGLAGSIVSCTAATGPLVFSGRGSRWLLRSRLGWRLLLASVSAEGCRSSGDTATKASVSSAVASDSFFGDSSFPRRRSSRRGLRRSFLSWSLLARSAELSGVSACGWLPRDLSLLFWLLSSPFAFAALSRSRLFSVRSPCPRRDSAPFLLRRRLLCSSSFLDRSRFFVVLSRESFSSIAGASENRPFTNLAKKPGLAGLLSCFTACGATSCTFGAGGP